MKKFLFNLIVGILAFGLCSCESTLKVTSTTKGAKFGFDTKLGSVFQDTIKSISQNVEGESSNEIAFEAEEIQQELEKAGFKNPKVFAHGNSSLSITMDSERKNMDPVNTSGFVSYGNEKTAIAENGAGSKVHEIILSNESLKAMYNQLPVVFKSYLDLFGAPVFSGEEMTDQEYIEMIACVYGQSLADEIAASELKVCLDNGKAISVPLVKLLNLENEIRIN